MPNKSDQAESVDVWAFTEGAFGFLSDVAHGSTRLVITIEGKPIAAVVPLEDLERLQKGDAE